jgi:hypothetical protein
VTARKKKVPAIAPPLTAAPTLALVPDSKVARATPAMLTDVILTLEFGMYGAHSKPQKGALWRASWFDATEGTFFAGSADDAFEAIGWAMYEREERIANNGAPTMTRREGETPLQALARLRGRL